MMFNKQELLLELLSFARRNPALVFTMIDLVKANIPITRANLLKHGRLTKTDLDNYYFLWSKFAVQQQELFFMTPATTA